MSRPIVFDARAVPRCPWVCTPLVAQTEHALLAEAADVAACGPDLVEWRVDYYERIGEPDHVAWVAARLKEAVGAIPVLFTRRSMREGGQRIAISEEDVAAVYQAVVASGAVDMVDWEMDSDPVLLERVRAFVQGKAQLLLSFHDFQATPPREALLARFARMEALGADVAKIAVMPASMTDVLALLHAMQEASGTVSIPVVGMAMGPLGAVTRAAGHLFGSAMTFAVGRTASAPGQMPIADVRACIDALERAAMDPGSSPG